MNSLRVLPCKKKNNYFEIYWGDDFWRSISKYLYINIVSKISQHADFKGFVDSYKELELKAIVKHALTMLGKRSYFTAELSKRLSAEGFSHAAVDHALEVASRCGALDDERRARYLIEKALERGKSKMSILYVFKKLGVDLHMINKLLDQMANDPRKQICALYDKKYSNKGPLDISNKRKVVQFFQRKGFALDDIFFVLQKKCKSFFA